MLKSCLTSSLPKIYKSANILLNFNRLNSSALYITGDKAHETFALLTPHLDFEERIKDKSKLEENLKLRELDINLDEIIRIWNFYKHIAAKKVELEESKVSIAQTIKALSKKGNRYEEKIEQLKAHGKMVKEDIKAMKESFWSVEEKAAVKVLSLPNILHEKTPNEKSFTVHTFSEKNVKTGAISHLEIAKNLDLVEYNNPENYYLKNEAALFELQSTSYFSDQLIAKNYTKFSNSDFARSAIVEGCGTNYSNPSEVFTINEFDIESKHENSRLHLTGSASLSSFMAYHARFTVFPSLLPLKYFTIGRKYRPVTSRMSSLFNVSQQTAVEVFIATKDDKKSMNSEFETVLKDVIDIYKSLGYHFQVCFMPAKCLQSWESLRASIQMFSPHLNDYIEVGNLSICDNYVSKRLLFNYGTGLNVNYPRVISGTLLSVPKLLACTLETDNSLLLPEILKF